MMITTVADLEKLSRGFFRPLISKSDASAYLRGQKTTAIVSAHPNIQKGDYIVFEVGRDLFHDIHDVVWEVTFVSYIPHSEENNGFGQVALSIVRRTDLAFHRGDINGEYQEDTITGDI